MLIEFFPKKIKRYAVIKEYAAVVQRIEVAGENVRTLEMRDVRVKRGVGRLVALPSGHGMWLQRRMASDIPSSAPRHQLQGHSLKPQATP